MKKMSLFLFALLALQLLHAQNVKSENIEYRYIKLPLTPLSADIKNYRSTIVAAYEAENQKKQAQYEAELAAAEADYQKEMREYPTKVKEAEDKYGAEMKEWQNKSFGEKFVEKEILKENNKPVKQLPAAPYKRSVQAPELKATYDYKALAGTYIILDGYTNNPENAVHIEVTLNGFDYTQPMQITQQRNITKVVNGTSTTTPVTYYSVEFTYRHVMSVKATTPDGREVFNIAPPELSAYKTYKTPESTTPSSIHTESLVKTYGEKILAENLTFINNLVNDRIGYKREIRKTEISYVKAKDDTYSDLMIAYNEASSALKTITDDEETAKNKLQHAIQIWNEALKDSKPNDKKARIDKDVTIMIYFNLLESYFALRNVKSMQETIDSLNTLDISNGERKQKEKYEVLLTDLKKRVSANKQ